MPVVGDEADVLAVAEGQHHGRLEGGLAEHGEALLVIREVSAVGLAVELGPGLAPHLGEEEGVVHEHAVHALLVLVEEAHLLAEGVHPHGGVPGALVLVVAGGDGHHLVPALGELHGERSDDVAEAARLGPGGHLGGDEDDLHRLGRLRGEGHLGAGLVRCVRRGGIGMRGSEGGRDGAAGGSTANRASSGDGEKFVSGANR